MLSFGLGYKNTLNLGYGKKIKRKPILLIGSTKIVMISVLPSKKHRTAGSPENVHTESTKPYVKCIKYFNYSNSQ